MADKDNLIDSEMGTSRETSNMLNRKMSSKRIMAPLSNDPETCHNDGVAALEQNDLEQAVIIFQHLIEIDPDVADHYVNLGVALMRKGNYSGAIVSNEVALLLDPTRPLIYVNMGACYIETGELDKARDYYTKALNFAPDDPTILNTLANIAECPWPQKKNLYNTALTNILTQYDVAESPTDPIYFLEEEATSLANYLYGCLENGEWDLYHTLKPLLENIVRDQISEGYPPCVSSYQAQILFHDSELQHDIIKHYAKKVIILPNNQFTHTALTAKPTLKIGYLSADFSIHPVGLLISRLFSYHDRNQVTVYGFSLSTVQDDLTQIIRVTCDHFIDISGKDYQEAAEIIYQQEIDILIDLGNFSGDSKPDILAYRPAPIQVSTIYGLACSLGGDYMDYHISSESLIKEEHKQFYGEKLVFLPESPIALAAFAMPNQRLLREKYQLPEDNVVFCCLSTSARIEPSVINAWIEILKQVDNSVLWLNNTSEYFKENLLKLVQGTGLTSDRVIFKDNSTITSDWHHRLADVYLDTIAVAGTTPIALSTWIGLPVVTINGETAAQRKGYVYLKALGLTELEVNSVEGYINLAVKLGKDKAYRLSIKAKMLKNRYNSSVFNQRLFAHYLDNAYKTIWEDKLSSSSQSLIQIPKLPNEQRNHYQSEIDFFLQPTNTSALPKDVETLEKTANSLKSEGKLDEAICHYQQILEIEPNSPAAYANIATTLLERGDVAKAIACNQTALLLDEENPYIYNNLGSCYLKQGDVKSATECYLQAHELKPDDISIVGNVLEVSGFKWGEILTVYQKFITPLIKNLSEDISKEQSLIAVKIAFMFKNYTAWEKYEEIKPLIDRIAQQQIAQKIEPVITPFLSHCFYEDDATISKLTQTYANQINIVDKKPFQFELDANKKVFKIGYLSADFSDQVVGFLIDDLFKHHDRSQYEIYCYSISSDYDSYTLTIQASSDHYINLSDLTYYEAAQKIYKDNIDILIDLTGFTGKARTQILAYQPAPVQAHYLGQINTMGVDFIPYHINGRGIILEKEIEHYNETIVNLPHASMALKNYHKPSGLTRSEYGLPEDKIVFCCFNSPYRIDQTSFNLWMDILEQAPNSVLWISLKGQEAEDLVIQKAKDRNIETSRLIFTPLNNLSLDWHHQLADIYLDTLSISSFTATFMALWAGIPVITQTGKTAQSRQSTSILNAANLEELVVTSNEAYVELAVKLATTNDALKNLKKKIKTSTNESPIFNRSGFVQELEQAFRVMWKHYCESSQKSYLTFS